MTEFYIRKLLGGIGNGEDAPGYWQDIAEWTKPGTNEKCIYEKRTFYSGDDRYVVWVDIHTPADAFQTVMKWHRETIRDGLISAQKELLRESMAAAANYTAVIMVAGYAALFTFWEQSKTELTPITSFVAAVALALSVFCFVGWEVLGMVIRSRLNIRVAKAVDEPARFEELMRSVSDEQARAVRLLHPVW